MALTFGPNLIGNTTTATKPKIVPWGAFTPPASLAFAGSVTQNAGSVSPGVANDGSVTTVGTVTEGQYAWAAFKFVDPTDTNVNDANSAIQQMDAVKLNFAMSGGSANDYINNGQLTVYTLDSNGVVLGLLASPSGTTQTLSYTDVAITDSGTAPTAGTSVYGLLLVAPVKADTLVETGDRVLFQVMTSEHTKFTDSAYVEQYMNIKDQFTQATRPKIVVSGEIPVGEPAGNTNKVLTPAVLNLLAGMDNGASINARSDLYLNSTYTTGSPGTYGNAIDAYTATTFASGTTLISADQQLVSEVKEGQWAIAKFSFVDPSTNNASASFDLDYPTELRVTATGASNADYETSSFKVYATDLTGNVYTSVSGAGGSFASTGGAALTITDGKVTLPAGTSDVILVRRTVSDTATESGEEAIFQVGKVDVDSFTASDYVEKKVKIKDYNSTIVVGSIMGATEVVSGDVNNKVVDEFVISNVLSTVSPGVFVPPSSYIDSTSASGMIAYAKISNFNDGDYLKIDIQKITSGGIVDVIDPGLPLNNFGKIGNLTEAQLVEGLQQLNGVQCVVGGVYVMGAGADTFIVIDSNSDGKLNMYGTTGQNPDAFVKLVGVTTDLIQSTDFKLV